MQIKTLTVGMLGTQCYLLFPEDGKECIVIDPGAEAARIRRAAEGKRIAAILLTHGHFDHIGAAGELMEADTRLLIHALDAPMLSDPVLNAGRALTGQSVTAPAPTEYVKEGDRIQAAGLSLLVMHTPGHTPGGVCYLAGEDLFTGDTMFHHGWGRTDLPGGNEEDMMRSLRRLIPISHTCRVYPGHAD